MNYADVTSKIQSIAEAVLDGKGLFHYGQTPQHALEGYNEQMPQIHLDPLQDTINYGSLTTRIPITIGFLDQDRADTSALEQAIIVNSMQQLSDAFMMRLNEEDLFSDITATRKPIYRYSQALLTGVTVSFTIETQSSLC